MSIGYQDFLGFAKSIQVAYPDETGRRNAISRAYYAAHHLARTVAPRVCPDPNANLAYKTHERVVEHVKAMQATVPRARALGLMLNDIKASRHKADYDFHLSISNVEADMQVKTAQRLVTEFEQIMASLPPP